MSVTAAEQGLRERKRAATRQALHAAAVRLAIEHGADRVTVEAIADEAGVSRRTFSNYFANKEQALLHGDHQRMHALVEVVRARPADERPWVALTHAAEEFYRSLGEVDPQWAAQGDLVRESLAELGRGFASAGPRVSAPPSPPAPATTAAASRPGPVPAE